MLAHLKNIYISRGLNVSRVTWHFLGSSRSVFLVPQFGFSSSCIYNTVTWCTVWTFFSVFSAVLCRSLRHVFALWSAAGVQCAGVPLVSAYITLIALTQWPLVDPAFDWAYHLIWITAFKQRRSKVLVRSHIQNIAYFFPIRLFKSDC